MKKLFTFLLFCLGSFTLFGQSKTPSDSLKIKPDSLQSLQPSTTDDFLKNTSIASPTAAALGKYADVPINYNTGLPSIGIPLTIVKGSQLSLPISLSYHGGGHKVAETASWVGLGWSLNAGGVISRQVMGGPDESWNGDKGTLPSTQGQAGITTISGYYNDYGFSLPQYVFGNPNTQESFEKQYKFICAGVGLLDTEPDIFSFNVGGTSGKFYFDADRKAHFIPEQDFKVEVVYSGNPTYEFDTFILTAPDGTRYHFGGNAYEKTGTVSGDGYGGSYLKSSWYLTKMESADRLDVITLSYVNEGFSFLNLNDEYHEQTNTGATQHVIAGNQHLTTAFYSRTQLEGKRLSEIHSSQLHAVFGATVVRADISSQFSKRGDLSRVFDSPKRLETLTISSVSNASEQLKYKFSYDYMQSLSPPTGTAEYALWTSSLSDNSDKQRLRLLSVQEVSGDESLTKPPHTFSYEATPLPRRLSFGRDHWGYANGQTDNKSLIDDAYISPRPNRGALWSSMKSGHLTKITYPTGGDITFTFEPHYTDPTKTTYIGGLRINSVKETFSTGQFTETSYGYLSYVLPTNDTQYSYSMPSSFSTWRDFVNSSWPSNSPLPFYSSSCPTIDPNNYPSSTSVSKVYNSALFGTLKSFLGSSPLYQNVKVGKQGAGYAIYLYGDITPFSASLSFPFSSGNMVNYVNNGKLTREEYYNQTDQLQRKVSYQYNSLPDYSSGAVVTAYKWYPFAACSQWLSFGVSKYSYYATRSLLLSKTETNYDLSGSSSVSSTTHYQYGTKHQQPIREAMLRSNGDSLITRSVFVFDYDIPPSSASSTTSLVPDYNQLTLDLSTYLQMLASNQNELMERVNYIKKVGNSIELAIEGRLQSYNLVNNVAGKVGSIHTLYLSQPKTHTLSHYAPSTASIAYDNFTYELRASFDYHSSDGLLWKESKRKGFITDYKSSPINSYNWSSNGLLASKALLNPNRYANNLATYYSHSLLYGVKSIEAPNSITTSFTYDKLGRLANITDHQQALQSQFSYYYGAANYVKSQLPRVAGYTLPTNPNEVITTHQYVDGLGRATQTIDKNGSPVNGLDLITQTQTYDGIGRPLKSYLPFAIVNSGHEVTPPMRIQGDEAGFSEVKQFDNSPLNRPLEQYGVGKAWRDASKFTSIAYAVNDGSIRLYTVDNAGAVTSSFYAAGTLLKTINTDEANHETIAFTDKEGRVIQKQVQDGAGSYQTTAYVYDDMGRLRFVVQPEGFATATSFAKTSTVFSNYIFGYEYDGRGRVIAKHVPGGGWSRTVYDVIDRPVLEQTALQAVDNKWSFIKYDGLGREIMRGEKVLTADHATLQQTVYDWAYIFEDIGTDLKGYTNRSLVVAESEVQSVNYYSEGAYPVAMPTHVYGQQAHSSAKGKVVEQHHRNGSVFDTQRSYYNNRDQLIYEHYEHSASPTFSIRSSYDPAFQGEMKRAQLIFEKNGVRDTLRQAWGYDHRGRAISYAESINSPQLNVIAHYAYDSIGRLLQKKLLPNGTYIYSGVPDYINRPPSPETSIDDVAKKAICLLPGTLINNITYSATISPLGTAPISGLQTLDYTYHIRGGLRGINLDASGNAVPKASEGDLFAYKLDYETAGLYDGNIGKQTWAGVSSSVVENRSYTYIYDPAKRLKTAAYSGINAENFSLPNMSYDKNGNITNLQRNGKNGSTFGAIDNLNYTYSGNRLLGVTDASNSAEGFKQAPFGGSGASYTYYVDGSLKSDANEQIQNIVYDTFLKQPKEVYLTDGRKYYNYYDGSGKLLKTVYYTATNAVLETWEYIGQLVYKNGVPYQLATPEGRATYAPPSGAGGLGAWSYEFNYQDHLGNTRVSFKAVGNVLTKTAETAFDPWGVRLNGVGSVNGFQNRWEFLDREKESTFGLNYYRLGARGYNPTNGRFDRVEPLTQGQENWSVYQYGYNNPIRYSDPDGLEPLTGQAAQDAFKEHLASRQSNNYSRQSKNEGCPPDCNAFERLFSNPKTKEEANDYANMRNLDAKFSKYLSEVKANFEEFFSFIPFGSAALGVMKANQNDDLGELAKATASGAFEAGGGMILKMGGKKIFGKVVQQVGARVGRDGKAVEIIFKDGSKIDITSARVKQWIPNTHPNAPEGTLQKVIFTDAIPGSKGYKRLPTKQELEFLNKLK